MASVSGASPHPPLIVASGATIDPDELWFTYSRSGGPGGQNVNKVNTRVTLRFDVAASPSLSDAQRHRLRTRLSTRITRDGILMVVSSRHRTQAANRRAATERFSELITDALAPRKQRRKTTVSHAAKRRRLDQKRRRSETKTLRGRVHGTGT